jgi:uncharacterized membrane protein YgcG
VRLLLLAVVALLALPAAARAQDLDEAVAALSQGYVYVDPDAEAASEVDAAALDRAIRESEAAPVFVAVLPASAAEGRTINQTLEALRDQAGISGTYALVLGRDFRAGADRRSVSDLATETARDHPGDIEATLEDFVGRVADQRTGEGGGIPWWFVGIVVFPFLGFFAVAVVGITWAVRSGRRKREEELAEVKRNTRDDLVALGEDIRALELDVQMPGANAEAAEAYADAVGSYERANRAFELARSTRDLKPAAEALAEGRYAMTWAREVFAGHTPPERRPPCFFDPRHGPSKRDVEWAPEGGTPRPVPACEADAQRVERGEEPQAREIDRDGQRVPYWEAGPAYAPFYGGFFPGVLIGSMVAGGWDDPTPTDHGGSGGFSDWGGGGGGGDFGGGGGDFGGGSF